MQTNIQLKQTAIEFIKPTQIKKGQSGRPCVISINNEDFSSVIPSHVGEAIQINEAARNATNS